MKLKNCIIVAICALLTTSLNVDAQSVDDIIDKYLENSGGIDKWKSLETIKMIGSVPTPQGDFPFKIFSKKPNKMRVEIEVQGMLMVPSAFDGKTAWMINPMAGSNTPQKLPDNTASAIMDQAQFEPPYIDYKDKGHEIVLEGTEEVEGVECFKLKVNKYFTNDLDDITEYHYLSMESYMPIKVSASQNGMDAETILSNYKETSYGITMPFTFATKTAMQNQEINFDEIVMNEPLSDDLFAFPEEDTTDDN